MKVKTEPVKAADSGDTADGALAVKDMSVSCLNFTPDNLADVQLICQRDIQLPANDIPIVSVICCMMGTMLLPNKSVTPMITPDAGLVTIEMDMASYTQGAPTLPPGHGLGNSLLTITGDCVRQIAALNACTQLEQIINVYLKVKGGCCFLVAEVKLSKACYWLPMVNEFRGNKEQMTRTLDMSNEKQRKRRRDDSDSYDTFEDRGDPCDEYEQEAFVDPRSPAPRQINTAAATEINADAFLQPDAVCRRNSLVSLLKKSAPINQDALGCTEEDLQHGRVKLPEWVEESSENLARIDDLYEQCLKGKVAPDDEKIVRLVGAKMYDMLGAEIPKGRITTDCEVSFGYSQGDSMATGCWTNMSHRLSISSSEFGVCYDLRISDDAFNLSYQDLRDFYVANRLGDLGISDVWIERVPIGLRARWFLVVRIRKMQYRLAVHSSCRFAEVTSKHDKREYSFIECNVCMRVPGSRQTGAAANLIVTLRQRLMNEYTPLVAIKDFENTPYKKFMPLAGRLSSSDDFTRTVRKGRKRARYTHQPRRIEHRVHEDDDDDGGEIANSAETYGDQ
jgi:hypothetical protein